MKKTLVIMLAVVLLFSLLAGCGSQKEESKASTGEQEKKQEQAETKQEQPDKKLQIAWVNPLVGHPVYVMHDEGCQMAAKDYNVDLQILGPSVIDAENMVQAIENAIAQKVDGIITVPLGAEAFVPVFKKAKEEGIPVVYSGVELPDNKDLRIAFIGTDNKAYGKMAAEVLAKEKNGAANICIMMSRLDIPNQVETKLAFEERIKEWPDMKVVVTEGDEADMAKAVQKFEEVFTAYPEIDAVVMLEATGAPAAAKVAKEKGIKVTVLGVDDTAETVDAIKKGDVWGTLAQNFYKMGYESVRFIADYHEGVKDIPSENDSGMVLVTKENVENYSDDVFEAIRIKGEPY